MIKKLLGLMGIVCAALCISAVITHADEVDIKVEGSDGYSTDFLVDDDYNTTDYYHTGDVLTVTSAASMDSLYIRWDTEPDEWVLSIDGTDYTYGKQGFLHEFVELPKSTSELKITIKKDRTYIADLYAFSGSVPEWVQKWNEPYDKADMLVISTHSDDEILFLGGAIATYVNEEKYRIQLAYYCDFSLTEKYRRHELLNGLWTVGIDHYPQLGEFMDEYSESLEEAKNQVNYDEVVSYFVRTIRRFKPQVIVTQDFDGEYGHGQHRLVAQAVADAVEVSADASSYQDSAGQYGTWDVLKVYYHLYADNPIKLDVRTPLAHFGGRTALEVAKAAYLEHQSQQWMWFHVSDGQDDEVPPPAGMSYSPIQDFGLYRTLVGADTGNDMMEHIVSYDSQEASEAETQGESGDGELDPENASAADGQTETQTRSEKGSGSVLLTILIIAGIVLVVIVVVIVILYAVAASKRRKKEEERRRRQAELRKARNGGARSENSQTRQRSTSSGQRSSRVKEVKDIK